MKKFLTTVTVLFCLTTGVFCQTTQNSRTTTMRSSSTRSTVNNNSSNATDIKSGYVGSSRFMGGNMRRSGVTSSMGTGMTRSLVGNSSHGTNRTQPAKNDSTKGRNKGE